MAAAMHSLRRRISITAPRGLKASSCARKGALSRKPRQELPLIPAGPWPLYFTGGWVAVRMHGTACTCMHALFSQTRGSQK